MCTVVNHFACIGLWEGDVQQSFEKLAPLLELAADDVPPAPPYRHRRWTDPSGASVAVASQYRRHGLAAAVLAELIRKARTRGADSIWLMVRRDNQPAIELYRKLGFRRTATVRGYYEDGSAGWRMQLT